MGRQRLTGWENRFLNMLRETGNVRWACAQAHINYDTVYKRRKENPAFREAWEAALRARQGEPQVHRRRARRNTVSDMVL